MALSGHFLSNLAAAYHEGGTSYVGANTLGGADPDSLSIVEAVSTSNILIRHVRIMTLHSGL